MQSKLMSELEPQRARAERLAKWLESLATLVERLGEAEWSALWRELLSSLIAETRVISTGAIFRLDRFRPVYRGVMQMRVGAEVAFEYEYLEMGRGLAGLAGAENRIVELSDETRGAYLAGLAAHVEMYCVPISATGTAPADGVLTMSHSDPTRRFTSDEKLLVRTACVIAGVALRQHLLLRTDSLTGLWNARAFSSDGPVFAKQAAAMATRLAIVWLDVDDLRVLNKRHDWTGVDDAFAELGKWLPTHVEHHPATEAYRLHGDEFALLSAARSVDAMVTDLRATMAARAFPPCGVGELHFSIGVAYQRLDETLRDLRARAERLTADAKVAGKNRVLVDSA
jgi:diguanylate cyclase (GGDEF)-like protein